MLMNTMGEVIKFPPEGYKLKPTTGSAGLTTQVPGAMLSVSNVAAATGGIKPGNLIKSDIG